MLSRLDLNLLRVFDAVMAEKNMTRAAVTLHMTQPAVSNAVNRLRLTVADALFVKAPDGVAPTHKAQLLWPPIRQALESIAEVMESEEFDPLQSTVFFRFAASDYVADQVIRPVFAALQHSAPNIRVHLLPQAIRNALPLLEKSEIDMAIGVFANFDAEVHSMVLETISYVCVMRKGHPALKGRFGMAELLSARHLAISNAGGITLVGQELANQGFKLNTVLTINHFSLAPRLLTETDLICILPSSMVKNCPYRDQLETVVPPVNIPPRTVSMVWHARSNNLASHRWIRAEIARVCAAEGLIRDTIEESYKAS